MRRDTSIDWHPVNPSSLDLNGTRAAVVGGTGGLGRAVSRSLASRGARVVVVGQTFRDSDVARIQFVKADLSLMREAERVANALPAEKLDLVVFTAGIFAAPERQETAEGIERDMAVSYLSRLVILRQIAARLGKDRPAPSNKPRIFVMGHPGAGQAGSIEDLNAEKSYAAMRVHMNTVAGNEMLVLDAARRYPDLSVFGLNPGLVKTGIRANRLGAGSVKHRFTEWMIGLLTPSPETYAAHLTPLLVAPELEGHSGAMFNRKGLAILPTRKLGDASYVTAFIEASEAIVSRVVVRGSPGV
jgi:NAD(P)-dependent dehydrogenase (short-subunit alcohol dehydrogenase family)